MGKRWSGRQLCARTVPMILLAVPLMLAQPASGVGADPANLSFNQDKIFDFMNAERAARGLAPVERDANLDAYAQGWSSRLAAERRGYHSPQQPALTLGYESGAENLAWGPSLDAAQAHLLWMGSEGDRRALLGPGYTHAGVGVACSTESGRQFVVAVVELGGPGPSVDETPPAKPRVAGNESMSGRRVTCDTGAPATSSLTGSQVVVAPVAGSVDPGPAADTDEPGPQSRADGADPAASRAGPEGFTPGMLAAAAIALIGAVTTLFWHRIVEGNIMAAMLARPRLNTRQLADLLDDYRMD